MILLDIIIMFLFLLFSHYVTCPIESLYVHWLFSWSFSLTSVCFPRKKKIWREKTEKMSTLQVLCLLEKTITIIMLVAAGTPRQIVAVLHSCGGFRHLDCCLWILCFWSCCEYYYYFDNLIVRKV